VQIVSVHLYCSRFSAFARNAHFVGGKGHTRAQEHNGDRSCTYFPNYIVHSYNNFQCTLCCSPQTTGHTSGIAINSFCFTH
jgi:hypothetical protein